MEKHLNKGNVIDFKDPWEQRMLELRPEREEKVKKDCAARKKQKGLDPIAHRNIWHHIKQTTWR